MRAFAKSLLGRFPLVLRVVRGMRRCLAPGVSSHYVALQGNEAVEEGQRLRGAWQDKALPLRQRDLVTQQLQQYRAGQPIDVFDVLAQSLRDLAPALSADSTLLEVGCSSGFYSEALEIAGVLLRYSGCDYSPAFIDLARKTYPGLAFSVEDATRLGYDDRAFDVVVSGCCLLHIPDYPAAVRETARVARTHAIFHRTPVVWGQPEQWYRKQAYGVETVEIHFNEDKFLRLLHNNGLDVVATHTLHEESSGAEGHAIRTYVCKKVKE